MLLRFGFSQRCGPAGSRCHWIFNEKNLRILLPPEKPVLPVSPLGKTRCWSLCCVNILSLAVGRGTTRRPSQELCSPVFPVPVALSLGSVVPKLPSSLLLFAFSKGQGSGDSAHTLGIVLVRNGDRCQRADEKSRTTEYNAMSGL